MALSTPAFWEKLDAALGVHLSECEMARSIQQHESYLRHVKRGLEAGQWSGQAALFWVFETQIVKAKTHEVLDSVISNVRLEGADLGSAIGVPLEAKPVTRDELAGVIREGLAGSQSADQIAGMLQRAFPGRTL